MEIEILKQKLKDEGFARVYECTDDPNTVYELHEHQERVSFYITNGDLTFDFNGEKEYFKTGDRVDVPAKTKHSVIVGPEGCSYVVGEEIEGDA